MKTSLIVRGVDTRVDAYSVPLIDQSTKPKHQRAVHHCEEDSSWRDIVEVRVRDAKVGIVFVDGRGVIQVQ